MRDTGSNAVGTADAAEGLATAQRLADALASDGWLEPRPVHDAPLGPGEVAYADLSADGWRYFGLDSVAYERRALLVGGPCLMAITAFITAMGNWRRRQAAERAAAPQWRPLGHLRVVVTSDRLLVWHAGGWWSVWFSSIAAVRSDPARWTLDLLFDADAPYRLIGVEMPCLAVVLSHAATTAGDARA